MNGASQELKPSPPGIEPLRRKRYELKAQGRAICSLG